MTIPFSASAWARASADLPLAVGPAMRARGGLGLAIATLIAAGRLDDRLLAEAFERLGGARLERWIDQGDAAEVAFGGDIAAAKTALATIDRLDFSIRAGNGVPAKLFVA